MCPGRARRGHPLAVVWQTCQNAPVTPRRRPTLAPLALSGSHARQCRELKGSPFDGVPEPPGSRKVQARLWTILCRARHRPVTPNRAQCMIMCPGRARRGHPLAVVWQTCQNAPVTPRRRPTLASLAPLAVWHCLAVTACVTPGSAGNLREVRPCS
jgi:hypothetical protein